MLHVKEYDFGRSVNGGKEAVLIAVHSSGCLEAAYAWAGAYFLCRSQMPRGGFRPLNISKIREIIYFAEGICDA